MSHRCSKLRAEFDEKYKQAEAADENLKSKADAVSDAIRQWRESYSPDAPKEEGQPEENAEAQPEENTENTDAKPEESSEENTEQPSEETAENTDAETPEEDSTPEINYVPEGKVLTASSSYNVRKFSSAASACLYFSSNSARSFCTSSPASNSAIRLSISASVSCS